MPNHPGSHRVNITVELGVENFRGTLTAAMNRQIQAVVMDLVAAYHSPVLNDSQQANGVHILLDVNYNIHPVDTSSAREVARFRVNTADPRAGVEINPKVVPAQPTLNSAAAGLLGFLPRVDLDALADEAKMCPVCKECFPHGLEGQDVAIRLRCSHAVGRRCMERWILGGRNSCPVCEAEVFKPARG